jgi:hypothetical protein
MALSGTGQVAATSNLPPLGKFDRELLMTLLQTPPNTQLSAKISALAAAIRRRLMLLGLLLTISSGLSVALILGTIDYLLHLPGPLRLTLAILFLLGMAGGVVWNVLRPAFRRVPRQMLAHHLERTGRLSHDEISAALDFLESGLFERNALAARAVEAAQMAAADIRLRDALSWRLIQRYAAWLLVVAAICAGLALSAPRLAGISLRRWTNPLAPNPWPLHVLVKLAWGKGGPPTILPSGDPFTVTAQVSRGFSPSLRVWLEMKLTHGSRQSQLMTWQGKAAGSRFEKVILPQSGKLQLRVRAGDDQRNPWVTIIVLPRPKILSMLASVAPPAYATGAPHYQIDLMTHRAQIIRGSTIRISAFSNQALVRAKVVGGPMPIRVVAPDGDAGAASHQAVIVYHPQASFTGRLQVTNRHELSSRRGGQFRVVVVPDALPQVAITHPRYALDLTPQAIIHLHIRASDDLGLSTLAIVGQRRGPTSKRVSTYRQSAQWKSLHYSSLTHEQIGKAVVSWTPQSMHLKAGDQVDLMAQVRDDYKSVTAPHRHPAVNSSRLVISILTPAQIQRQLQRSLQGVRHAIESLIKRQRATRDQTQLLRQAIKNAHALTAAQKMLLAQSPSQQNREALSGQAIARELRKLASIARRNDLSKRSIGRTITMAQHVMADVGQHVMPRAQGHLSSANRLVKADHVSKALQPLASAAQRQNQAIRRMTALVARLGAAGQFSALRQATARLLAKQQSLEQQLRQLAKQTLGQRFSKLSRALQKQLKQLGAMQKALASSASHLASRLNRAAGQLAQSNPHMAKALKSAAQLSAQYSVPGAMDQASGSAAQNHLQSASGGQKQAAKGLGKMLHALNKEVKRSLSRQISRIKSLVSQVKLLLQSEKMVATATAAEPPNSSRLTLEPIANEQSKLELVAAELAGKSRRADPSGYAHAFLMAASHEMGRATGQMENANQPLAVPHQSQAIRWLKKALAILQKLLNKDLARQQMQTLSGLKAIYEKIRHQQRVIYLNSKQLEAALPPGHPPTRLQILRIAGNSKGETQLMHQLSLITHKIASKAPLLAWMNRGISKAMHAARRRLDQAQVDGTLLADQQMAISQLDAVIEALKNHMKHLASGGGGGGGGGGKQPLIPPAAQLKLLRILQLQINLQTQQLHNQLQKTASAAERKLIRTQIQMLGRQQNRIHKQAIKMVKSMEKGGG